MPMIFIGYRMTSDDYGIPYIVAKLQRTFGGEETEKPLSDLRTFDSDLVDRPWD